MDQADGFGEVRKVDPTTGGMKGQKPERYDLIPWDSMAVLARVYGYGAKKYEDTDVGEHNWRRGYRWSLNFAAMMRHATAWYEGESYDPESGIHHLAHAAWHCLTLIWFEIHGRGTDDRPCRLFP